MNNYALSPATVGLLVLGCLLVAAVSLIMFLWRKYEYLLQEQERAIKEASQRSVEQSRSTLKGKIAEQMAPLLAGFAYAPADSRFIGNPIDYLVFDGYTNLADLDGAGDELEIVLLEIKQGQAALSREQRAIGRAVEEGRVRFEVTRVADDGSVTTSEWRPTRRKQSC